MPNSVERFTETVADYARYRPSYPRGICEILLQECALTPEKIIADVGSGTGLLTKLLLQLGNQVYGIEPNPIMREASKSYLKDYKAFTSIEGTAEQTHLENNSVDLITVGTAFHWFDPVESKKEFLRILKPSSWVMLVWNVRDLEHSGLMRDYEQLVCQYATDYLQSRAIKFDHVELAEFFSPHEIKTASFKNAQLFDWKGLKGRLLSTSYSLRPGDRNYAEMIAELKKIFNHYQQDGMIEFSYITKAYYEILSCSHTK